MAVPLTTNDGLIEQYIPAGYRRDRDLPEPQWIKAIVLHTPEIDERFDAAEAIARYFAGPEATARPASTHFSTDPTGAIRSIPDHQFGAGAKGLNRQGLHIEMAGRARQTRAEWFDDYSVATMEVTAKLCALYVVEYALPIQFLDADDLRSDAYKRGELRGFTTHAEAFQAFGGAFRSDPGPHFPLDYFLNLVRLEVAALTGAIMDGVDFCELGDGVESRVERPKVRYWQRILRAIGAYTEGDGQPGKLDGRYDARMARAVALVTSSEDGNALGDQEAFQIHRAWIKNEARKAVDAALAELPPPPPAGGGLVPHTHEFTVAGSVGDAIPLQT